MFYRFNPETGKLGMSYAVFKTSDLRPLGKFILSVFSLLRLVQVETGVGEDKKSTRVNNFTLINFVIKILGPLHERTLTTIMLLIQVGVMIEREISVIIILGPVNKESTLFNDSGSNVGFEERENQKTRRKPVGTET